ncbi:hypothetical protein [Moraxella oblonga]|uniref:hypothetical protein n=1 Tax=Moraxella oblonga TaxID=200413 RepID=UPI000AC85878|nr:hypothetical protein [Moraxella oblonga]
MNYIAYFNQICHLNEQNPINLSKKLLNLSAKEYHNDRKLMLANDEFIENIIGFSCQENNEKIIRNAILILGHIGFMYQFFPNSAFEFILQYKDEKKLIFYVAKSIHLFPQFIRHQEYSEILLKLANGTPKKECMLLLYVIISRLLDKIDDNEFLLKIVDIFKEFIERYPQLYQSQNEYPNLIGKILENYIIKNV